MPSSSQKHSAPAASTSSMRPSAASPSTGFHRTTMQDICRDGGGQPRRALRLLRQQGSADRRHLRARPARVRRAARGVGRGARFPAALACLGEQYFLEERPRITACAIEIGLESTRNPRVGEIFQTLRQLHHRELREAVPEAEGRGPHRARARYPDHRQGLHGHLRRHVLAPRRRQRVRRGAGHARGAQTDRGPVRTPAVEESPQERWLA